MVRFVWLIGILLISVFTYAQPKISIDSLLSFPIIRPNVLPVHPLANLSTRLLGNFKYSPGPIDVNVTLSNGNVWLPETFIFYPINPTDIDSLMQMPWHYRKPDDIASENEVLKADGVFRTLNISLQLPVAKHHEFGINLRSLYLEQGKKPYCFLNNDASIEYFHSHIYGGEDPFARKVYGLDKAELYYRQIDGDRFQMANHDFLIAGITLSHYYYPDFNFLSNSNAGLNLGQVLGINTTSFNPSLDYGLTINAIKSFNLTAKKLMNLSISSSMFYHQLIKFASASHVYEQNINWMAEGNLEYKWITKRKNRLHSIALDFFIQSSYKRGYRGKDKHHEFHYNGVIISGKRYTSLWHTTATQLMEPLQSWSFIYSYCLKNTVISIYLQEDLKVNNAPDTQTGIGVSYYL